MVSHGTLAPWRAMWIALMIGNTRVGILNVYALIDARLRCGFRSAIVGALPFRTEIYENLVFI